MDHAESRTLSTDAGPLRLDPVSADELRDKIAALKERKDRYLDLQQQLADSD